MLPSLSLDRDYDLLFSGVLLLDLTGDFVGLPLLRHLDLLRLSLDLDLVCLPFDLDLLPLDLDLVLVFLPLDLDLDLRHRDINPKFSDLLLLLPNLATIHLVKQTTLYHSGTQTASLQSRNLVSLSYAQALKCQYSYSEFLLLL